MNKKKEKLFVLGSAVIVILVAVFYLPHSNSYLASIFEIFEEPDWDNIPKKYIIKNWILISLKEESSDGKNCIVIAEKFDHIIEHPYFIKANELVSKLNYDKDEKTLTIPCNMLEGDMSKLHVWYIKEESPQHATKYNYFVTGDDYDMSDEDKL